MKRVFASVLSVLILTLAVWPHSAYALFGVGDIVNDPILTTEQIQANILQNSVSTLDVIKNTITSIAEVASEVATWALYVKAYVLDPAAFILSGNMLRSLTAGVVNFINGGNSGGNPLYVQNLSQHLLGTGDRQALVFFGELGQSNSPFGATILNSLRIN
jgi:hypothetical protein